MDGRDKLKRLFELNDEYRILYRKYCERGFSTAMDPKDKEFGPGQSIEHYYSVGADALRLITDVLASNLRSPPKSILDFPSGSGRVTRHLRAYFPDSEITACDLYEAHIQFCVDAFNVNGIISKENLDDVDFGKTFDLIFCGSLVTHLPEALFESTLQLLVRSLSKSGIAIVTTHGRYSEFLQYNAEVKYCDPRLYEIAYSTVLSAGFGYVDYDPQFVKGVFNKHTRYGVSFSRPHWIMKKLEKDDTSRILGYIERGWDEHQDVIIFGKPALNL
jgi:SAM-dependent methyltransferase